MTYIYFSILPCHQPVSSETRNWWLSKMPDSIRNDIGRFRRWEDAEASLFGKVLLYQFLCDFVPEAKMGNLQFDLLKKPYFSERIPHFNISHSGRHIVCVHDFDSEVGIDVEEINDIDLLPFQSCFRMDEWNSILQSMDPKLAFYSWWTKKEAVLKADGKGLSVPLTSLSITKNRCKLSDTEWHIHNIELSPTSICHVASKMNHSQSSFLVKRLFFD